MDRVEELHGIRIVKAGIGVWHVACVCELGGVYEWGWLQAAVRMSTIPTLVEELDEDDDCVVDVSCGAEHTIAMTKDGTVSHFNNRAVNNLYIRPHRSCVGMGPQ